MQFVYALYIYAKDLVKIWLGGSFQVTDMRDSGIVDQNLYSPLLKHFVECDSYALLLGNVAAVGLRVAAGGHDLACNRRSCIFIDVEHADACSAASKSLRNCPPDAAGTASHHRQLAIQAERVGKTGQKMPPSSYACTLTNTETYLDCSFRMRSSIAKALCASASSGANASAVCNSFSASPMLPVRP